MTITVREFLKQTENCSDDYEIRMSCLYENSHKEHHIQTANCGYLWVDYDVCFEIDWDTKSHTTLKDFKELLKENNTVLEKEIISWDVDDGNMINFSQVIIGNKVIVLN